MQLTPEMLGMFQQQQQPMPEQPQPQPQPEPQEFNTQAMIEGLIQKHLQDQTLNAQVQADIIFKLAQAADILSRADLEYARIQLEEQRYTQKEMAKYEEDLQSKL